MSVTIMPTSKQRDALCTQCYLIRGDGESLGSYVTYSYKRQQMSRAGVTWSCFSCCGT